MICPMCHEVVDENKRILKGEVVDYVCEKCAARFAIYRPEKEFFAATFVKSFFIDAKKIEGIKALRNLTNMGLKEAKLSWENIDKELQSLKPISPFERPETLGDLLKKELTARVRKEKNVVVGTCYDDEDYLNELDDAELTK